MVDVVFVVSLLFSFGVSLFKAAALPNRLRWIFLPAQIRLRQQAH